MFIWVTLLGVRIGEAATPGPLVAELQESGNLFCIGTTNADGLSNRVEEVSRLPFGIWGFAETQMTHRQAAFFTGSLRKRRKEDGLDTFVAVGSDIACRKHSSSSGCWSGVAAVGHVPLREIKISWPDLHYSTGRVLLVGSKFQGRDLTGAVVYGYANSQTHVGPTRQTNELLRTLTAEVVLGRGGCRYIMGDMNQNRMQHEQTEVWRRYGWQEVQSIAEDQFGHEPCPTCKGKTFQDQLWVSPELARCLKSVQVCDSLFPTHAAVAAYFDLGLADRHHYEWPAPAFIPWSKVDTEGWKASWSTTGEWKWGPDVSRSMEAWSERFEKSLDGFVESDGMKDLPRVCKGRGRIRQPMLRRCVAPLSRPSRMGDHVMAHELLGRRVHLWFRQLRRFQALKDSLVANKDSHNARSHRASLWGAIKNAHGFRHGFRKWWLQRKLRCDGSPDVLQESVPELDTLLLYSQDFEMNYRSFENFHKGKRQQSLKLKLAEDENAVFKLLRNYEDVHVSTLDEDMYFEIVQVRSNFEVQLHPCPTDLSASFQLAGEVIELKPVEESWFRVEGDVILLRGHKITSTKTLWDENEIAEALRKEWRERWMRHAATPAEQWQRVSRFAQAYFPRVEMSLKPISLSRWQSALKSFRANSARGPDAWCRDDLLHMPDQLQKELLQLITSIEEGEDWPSQTMVAIVVVLKKHSRARLVGDYRPIALLSFLYRVWSSIRCRELLKLLEPVMNFASYGFLPGRGTSHYTWSMQAAIELALQTEEPLHGYTGDVVKAFNYIPRAPIYEMATVVGTPEKVLGPWRRAHSQVKRRFKVRQVISGEEESVTGLLEGDPMSCYGMVLCDLYFHIYFQQYMPNIHTFSYVDNLSLLSTHLADLVQGTQVFQTWLTSLDLALDVKKSYAWSTDGYSRKRLQQASFVVKNGARDLGAQMQFGWQRAVTSRDDRLKSVAPLWPKLASSSLSIQAKTKGIRLMIWPKALHAAQGVFIPETAIAQLRTGAMKGLRFARAGSSPVLRLGFCIPQT